MRHTMVFDDGSSAMSLAGCAQRAATARGTNSEYTVRALLTPSLRQSRVAGSENSVVRRTAFELTRRGLSRRSLHFARMSDCGHTYGTQVVY